MTDKFIVSHPTGNTFVRALIQNLHSEKKLESFFTTIGIGDNSILRVFKIKRRKYDIPKDLIKSYPLREFIRLFNFLSTKHFKKRLATDEVYFSLDSHVARNLKQSKAKFLHTYEDCAFRSFKEAKKLGIGCSYELPIAHWAITRRLLSEESERLPEWKPTLESTNESEEKLVRKNAELEMADKITCPSQFVLESIPIEIRRKKPCQVIPFGSPKCEKFNFDISKNKKSIFKLLFVGSMTQRKGLADIFEAMKLLRGLPISLSVLGQPAMKMEFYRKQHFDFKYFPPCSNKKVRQIMKSHNALVLPSLIEGRALVQQEALSCGLPIIITPNTGGQDLVVEGLTGHLIPIRSPAIIAEKIVSLIESKLSKADFIDLCQKKAAEYSWSSYAKRIIDFKLA